MDMHARPARAVLYRAARLLVLLALASATGLAGTPAEPARSPTAVPGVHDQHLDPQYWIQRQADADRVILDEQAIAGQNRRLLEQDASVHDLSALPSQFSATEVRDWVGKLSARPSRGLYDEAGQAVAGKELDTLVANLGLEAVPAQVPARHGLVVRRADLRTFPTRLRVFNEPGNTDIDRFQESALFPGMPVVVIHRSGDGQWLFVISAQYAAWVEQSAVAQAPAEQVRAYMQRSPRLIVTGATARTVHNPQRREVSDLQLEMGIDLPLLAQWPPDELVNGQHPYTSYVVQLPVRRDDGSLALVPALVPRSADVATRYLDLTPANLLRQSFKFLGERYGWGHSYGTRDCSGFVSEVYRSFGVLLPRNTSAQAVSPALNRIAFDADTDRATRLEVLRSLQVGDLVYIPGHVMMVIGHEGQETYLIHDTAGISYRGEEGQMVRARLNSVAVTPLLPLMLNEEDSYVDRITNIQRIRP